MEIRIRSLVEGLSFALDAAEKLYFSHSKHVAYMAVCLAGELGMTDTDNLYYAALLHDIGASNTYKIEEHCLRGEEMVAALPLRPEIAGYVLYHHEYENGMGPFGKRGEDVPAEAGIICLANLFDTRFAGHYTPGPEFVAQVLAWMEENRGYFRPALGDAFMRLLAKEYFLLDYFNPEFGPVLKKVVTGAETLGYEGVLAFARAFAGIIDNRSPFTHHHSQGLAGITAQVAQGLGYPRDMSEDLYIASLLHDLGKLTISNDIIDKPGRLEPWERFEINKHTYYTRWILQQVEGFERIVEYAANHHEKMDGRGYPLHLPGEALSEPERVMAVCDIYQALTEDRPYRTRMPEQKVWEIICGMGERGELDLQLTLKIREILS